MAKALIDYMSETDYARYNELLSKAEVAKANAPKPPRKPRGPMSLEQKTKLAEKRVAKYKAQLDALLAADVTEG